MTGPGQGFLEYDWCPRDQVKPIDRPEHMRLNLLHVQTEDGLLCVTSDALYAITHAKAMEETDGA